MIDTIKIISMINLKTYTIIKSLSKTKTSYDNKTGEIFYSIVNDNLSGSYSSSLSIKIGEGAKYNFFDMYYIEIEGSYHKLMKGYNSHNGYYNPVQISIELIKIVENEYNIKLPKLKHWFIQRIDIAICYDLKNQANVETYINNLSSCNYPRRKLKHYEDESIYLTGSTSTLKIYNKKKEFIKHDIKKFDGTDFNLYDYLDKIEGFIRFECEIKKPKLKYIFKTNYLRIYCTNYEMFKNIWNTEFRRFFKIIESDLNIVNEKELVKNRLNSLYGSVRAKNLFNFYLLILLEGLQEIKKSTNKSMYYKNIADLKKANIDFTQKLGVNLQNEKVNFNPFEQAEIL